jgi:hypothetical protein
MCVCARFLCLFVNMIIVLVVNAHLLTVKVSAAL